MVRLGSLVSADDNVAFQKDTSAVDVAAWWLPGFVQLLRSANVHPPFVSDLVRSSLLHQQRNTRPERSKLLPIASNPEAWLQAGLLPAVASFAGASATTAPARTSAHLRVGISTQLAWLLW